MKKEMRIKKMNKFTILINLILLTAITLFAQNSSKPDNTNKVWIYFKDKGTITSEKLHKAAGLISERALHRRHKVKPDKEIITARDLPVKQAYIDAIKPYIKKLRARSRWLNAVSVELTPDKISIIKSFDFVKRVTPVLTYRKDIPKQTKENIIIPDRMRKKSADIDYGESATQLQLIGIPELHKMGFFGQGVLICMLDDGFNLLNLHETFDSLDVVDTWDFINNDASVDDTGLNGAEGWHGTKTLSTIAGYSPGILIGPAFKASYLLAKTEVDGSETRIEEDYWVAGIEWAEYMGADIVSSSLGYIDWYTPEDMDGKTAVTTIAADIAVDLGVVVVNSAGNEYYNADENTLIAPADGFGVFAVAAVTGSGERASFSSVGPSADGRIKPDFAAMGSGVIVASSYDSTGYNTENGTSFSCPLAAGAIALMLNAYPQLTPEKIFDAITSTASQADHPDRLLGWGILDIEAAYYAIDTSDLEETRDKIFPEFIRLEQNYPNPFNIETTISYSLKNHANVVINIYDLQGRLVASFPQGLKRSIKLYQFKHDFSRQASGIYFYQIKATEIYTSHKFVKSKKMVLLK